MKKVLFGVLLLGLAVSVTATPLLVEAYQEGQINIPAGVNDTLVITEVTFSVDTSCYVLFTTGGRVVFSRIWLKLDDSDLSPVLLAPSSYDFANIAYSYLLTAGQHTVSFMLANFHNQFDPVTCEGGYLQALIFLPDAGSAVAEQPTSGNGLKPIVNTPSVVSSGPYVTVTGATELVDATGRIIENAIEDDRVSINNLSQGTYFARDGERTVVKIVKID